MDNAYSFSDTDNYLKPELGPSNIAEPSSNIRTWSLALRN